MILPDNAQRVTIGQQHFGPGDEIPDDIAKALGFDVTAKAKPAPAPQEK